MCIMYPLPKICKRENISWEDINQDLTAYNIIYKNIDAHVAGATPKRMEMPSVGFSWFYSGRVQRPAPTSTAQASIRSLLPPLGRGDVLNRT
jgi:hypothetical protein